MHSLKIHCFGGSRTAEDQPRGVVFFWLLLLVGLLIVMVLQQWKLCLLVTICSTGSMFVRRKIEHIYASYWAAKAPSKERLTALFEESSVGHEVIRISRAERRQKAEFASCNQTYYEADRKMHLCSMAVCQIIPICSIVGTVLILSCSSIMIIHGSTNMKTAIIFLCYFYLMSFFFSRLEACR